MGSIEPYPPCFQPIGELTKTTFDELTLNTYFVGTVVFVKLLTLPIRGIPLVLAGEDEHGTMRRLQFYNQSLFEDPNILFPEGRIIAIKEPFYKSSPHDYEYIRVDHPSNIMILRQTADIIPASMRLDIEDSIISAAEWKSGGNEAVLAEDYLEAINCYSQALLAIRSPEEESLRAVILRNRAQMFIDLGFYDDAKVDALASLKIQPGYNKTLYRAARACYELDQYEECQEYLQQLLNVDPTEPKGLKDMSRVQTRLREQETGKYDFKHMTEQVVSRTRGLDHANFTRRVAVKDSEKHGRGLFTTEAVKAGDLLLVEKAFGTVTDEAGKQQSNTSDPLPCQNAVLLSELVQKAYRTPSLLGPLLHLYAGPTPNGDTKEDIVDGRPVFDTFRLADVINYNVFGFDYMSSDNAPGRYSRKKSYPKYKSATGVWLTASYTNHSCSYNAMRAFIGNIMIVRATRDLAAGEEVTMTYVGTDDPVLARRNSLRDTWGFDCYCALCKLEMKSLGPFERKRAELLGRIKYVSFEDPVEVTDEGILRIRNMAHQIENLYDKNIFVPGQPRVELSKVLVDIASMNAIRGNITEVKLYSRKAMEYLGFKIEVDDNDRMTVDRTNSITKTHCITACIHMASTYDSKAVMLQAIRLAKQFYKICYGEDDTFTEKYQHETPDGALEFLDKLSAEDSGS
ncbi:SET domain-containing protein [Saccharata proteae CBS 121410]|uniref:SET domain-containing protein n=1 Tax=Saccharata proteae CBS 121410 TaxID=1314787 RepID=A0A9P4HTN5_9PEZI|nr:SET domain-containing protein [Saccharata proteae CBS 121410]